MALLHFEPPPPFWGFQATYRTLFMLRLLESMYWTSYSDNWTFLASYYVWGMTSKYLLKIGIFEAIASVWPNISGKMGHPHNPFFLSEN